MIPRHETLLSRVADKKFSVNPQNTRYVIGPAGSVAHDGTADYRYDTFMIIRDAGILWTHGKAHYMSPHSQAELDSLIAKAEKAEAMASQSAAAAAAANEALKAVKDAISKFSASGDVSAIASQVLSNTEAIASMQAKLPNYRGQYVQGVEYKPYDRVTHLGSEFQAKHDGVLSEPVYIDGQQLVWNTDDWEVISNGSDAVLLVLTANRVYTITESAWETLQADSERFRRFCESHKGWAVDVIEDDSVSPETEWSFGGAFPIVF